MKKVTLFDGIQSSVIGFGCAPIMGSVDSKTAKIAIQHALEMGVNHFDLARSYGYGDAEQFVGKIIKPYREDVVIASKFGIKANLKAKFFKPIKPAVRILIDLKKQYINKKKDVGKPNINLVSDFFHDRIDINVNEMTKSLEESLNALKTDYLDYFLIHEPLETIQNIDELINASKKLKEEGKIRGFGITYMQDEIDIHRHYLDEFDVLQFNNSPGVKGYEKMVDQRAMKPNIFFSPLRGGSQELSVNDKLVKLHQDFPSSVILCSMFNTKHITENTKLFNK